MSRRLLAQVAVGLLALAACGSDDRTATPEDTATSSSTSSSSATNEGADWCEDLAALLESEGDVTAAEITGAPDEIAAALKVLVEATETDDLGRSMEAYASVQEYGYDRCGRDHPFCSLWITLSGAIAASAFIDADPEEVSADLEEVIAGMDDVLLDHVPPDELAHLQTLLASIGDPTLSDTDERAAESAEDALDQWAWSEGCEGASEPLADE